MEFEAIARTAGIVIGSIFTLWVTIQKTFNRNGIKWKNALQKIGKVKPVLQDMVFNHEQACHVSLCYLENGGGTPYVGAQLYSSILVDAYDPGRETYVDNWQQVRVNTHLLHMLQIVAIEGMHIVEDVEKLPPGPVKDSAIAMGVTGFSLHFIKATRKKWYYLTISHCKKGQELNAAYRTDIRILIDKLERMIK